MGSTLRALGAWAIGYIHRMATSLLDTFRVLSAFDPPRRSLADAPWNQYVDWAIAQGLAPLAAYNLEYRLAGGGAPEWARDRLLSVYQGSLNDNVMKLVNFKRAIDDVESERIILLGGASFSESLYPHIAFRPVPDIHLLVARARMGRLVEHLAGSHFRPEPSAEDDEGAAAILSDGRTQLLLFADLLGARREAEERGLFERALPVRVYGPSMYRLDLEDAILALCLQQARAGYQVPMLFFLDLRELLTGAQFTRGAYSRPPDFAALKQRASTWKIERALFASTSIIERLFPSAAAAGRQAQPELRAPTRRLLERLIIDPVSRLGQTRVLRGADRMRRLLAGGD